MDRRTNQFKFIPSDTAERALHRITSETLLRRSVWDVFTSLDNERAGDFGPGGFQRPGSTSDAPDDSPAGVCKDRVQSIVNYGKGLVAAGGLALGFAGKDSGGLGSAFVQIGDAVLQDLVQPIANFGCDFFNPSGPSGDIAPGGGAPEWQDPAASEWLPYEPTGTTSSPGTLAPSDTTSPAYDQPNPDEPDPAQEWDQWPGNSDPATPPPPPPGDSNPNPEDDNGRYSKPPGFHGPWPPGGELPNPDDIGGGPTSFPNGAVFVPLRTIRAVALLTRTSVTATQVGASQSGVATFQLSVNSSAVGASP
jgi:hypothetical protein